jgi:hypothetical protein
MTTLGTNGEMLATFTGYGDSFILAGSFVIMGTGEILVLTVGARCSFQLDMLIKETSGEETPKLAFIKRTMDRIENLSKSLTFLLVAYISISQLLTKYGNSIAITWADLLETLRIFYGFVGLNCFVSGLKIIKSLQFYI